MLKRLLQVYLFLLNCNKIFELLVENREFLYTIILKILNINVGRWKLQNSIYSSLSFILADLVSSREHIM